MRYGGKCWGVNYHLHVTNLSFILHYESEHTKCPSFRYVAFSCQKCLNEGLSSDEVHSVHGVYLLFHMAVCRAVYTQQGMISEQKSPWISKFHHRMKCGCHRVLFSHCDLQLWSDHYGGHPALSRHPEGAILGSEQWPQSSRAPYTPISLPSCLGKQAYIRPSHKAGSRVPSSLSKSRL